MNSHTLLFSGLPIVQEPRQIPDLPAHLALLSTKCDILLPSYQDGAH